MRDQITIWSEKGKVKLTKYYLTMFLKEAHFMYCKEDPEHKVGFSLFCNLKPKNVLQLGVTPKNKCKCKVHETSI